MTQNAKGIGLFMVISTFPTGMRGSSKFCKAKFKDAQISSIFPSNKGNGQRFLRHLYTISLSLMNINITVHVEIPNKEGNVVEWSKRTGKKTKGCE